MGIELSAEGERIAEVLPEAQAGLDKAQSELRGVEQEAKGLDKASSEIGDRHSEELRGLASNKTQEILADYSPRLQSVIALALGNKDMVLPDDPDLEACQKIAELDAIIKDSAGQPIVVINPEKNWVDFAMLEEDDPDSMIDTKGLVIGRTGPSVHSKDRIELPTYSPLAIDPKTGSQPEDDDVELQLREHRHGLLPRIVIDPKTTKAVLSGEKAEDYQEGNEDTTLVLVGYENVREILNDIFGFEPGDDEAIESFFKINALIKKLGEKSIDFDPDFINGYLSHRIAELEKEIQEAGGVEKADRYKVRMLNTLHDKHASLAEDGWLSR
ncbi:MAG TPA: hypothetical protein VFX79_02965 [Candidatus Saccharimonadales bacterium]|nr:hypothetical protein [Candidatus Saccharimonadales bacterium]